MRIDGKGKKKKEERTVRIKKLKRKKNKKVIDRKGKLRKERMKETRKRKQTVYEVNFQLINEGNEETNPLEKETKCQK